MTAVLLGLRGSSILGMSAARNGSQDSLSGRDKYTGPGTHLYMIAGFASSVGSAGGRLHFVGDFLRYCVCCLAWHLVLAGPDFLQEVILKSMRL